MEKAREFQKNFYFCFIDYAKAFDCKDHNKLWKILRWEPQTILSVTWETCMQDKKHQLEPNMKQQIGSKLGEEYDKAVYGHPAYLTSMQSTSCKMLGRMKQAGIKIAKRNISNLKYADDTTLMAENEEELKKPLDESEKGEWKSGLKTQQWEN